MKESKICYFIMLAFFQFLFNFQLIHSFGIKDANKHLLIYFIQEKDNTEKEALSDENYMRELMYREIYSKFNIGIPGQNLKFYYEMNNHESYIYEGDYYKARTTTYKLIDKRYQNISSENNKFEIKDPNGYLSQELFELGNDKKIEDFKFILKPKSQKEVIQYVNGIGLGYSSQNDSLSFLDRLKEKKYIHEKVFSFLFGDDSFSENSAYDGQILLGIFPHDISPYFDGTELYYIPLKDKDNSKWHINFDSVKYKEDELKDKTAELDINLRIIIGPEKFRKKLTYSFFRDFLDNKKCKESYFTSKKDGEKYIFYSFDKDIQFKEIPELSFYSKELNETFKLSFSNLFIKYRERYYFNVIFKKKPDNKWVFGQIFFNMYRFVFDSEEGKIGYYKTYSSKNHPMIVLLCLAVFAFIFIIGYWRGNTMKKNEANLFNKQSQYQVRKEYQNIPTNDENDNKKNNDKTEEPKEKEQKDKENISNNNEKIKKE